MKLSALWPKNNATLLFPIILIAPFLMGVSWPGVPLEEVADVIVIMVPAHDHALHVPMPEERPIEGKIIRVDKGNLPATPNIVHTPHTITAPLNQGIPKKLYLKKFPDRDAYYLIGVDPVQGGGKQ